MGAQIPQPGKQASRSAHSRRSSRNRTVIPALPSQLCGDQYGCGMDAARPSRHKTAGMLEKTKRVARRHHTPASRQGKTKGASVLRGPVPMVPAGSRSRVAVPWMGAAADAAVRA